MKMKDLPGKAQNAGIGTIGLTIICSIAPAGVRDLGYWEGRWIAMILDRLSPDWKNYLKNNDTLFLEQILGSLLNDYSYRKKTLSKKELSIIKSAVEEDFK
jgi:hypothetical protein